MKNLFFLIFLVSFLSACASGTQKESEKKFEKGLTGVNTKYPNIEKVVGVDYDSINRVTSLITGDVTIKTIYGENNKPVTLDFYFNNELSNSKTLNWYNDSLEVLSFEETDGILRQSFKAVYVYNVNNEMVAIYNFVQDSIENWVMMGSRFEFVWSEGNLTSTKCFIPTEEQIGGRKPAKYYTDDESWVEVKNVSDKLAGENFELFYEVNYTYDTKNNPYYNTSVSQLLIPGQVYISKNNPLIITQKFNDGEVFTQNCKYEYNESGFPVSLNVSVNSNIDNFAAQYTRIFNY